MPVRLRKGLTYPVRSVGSDCIASVMTVFIETSPWSWSESYVWAGTKQVTEREEIGSYVGKDHNNSRLLIKYEKTAMDTPHDTTVPSLVKTNKVAPGQIRLYINTILYK